MAQTSDPNDALRENQITHRQRLPRPPFSHRNFQPLTAPLSGETVPIQRVRHQQPKPPTLKDKARKLFDGSAVDRQIELRRLIKEDPEQRLALLAFFAEFRGETTDPAVQEIVPQAFQTLAPDIRATAPIIVSPNSLPKKQPQVAAKPAPTPAVQQAAPTPPTVFSAQDSVSHPAAVPGSKSSVQSLLQKLSGIAASKKAAEPISTPQATQLPIPRRERRPLSGALSGSKKKK